MRTMWRMIAVSVVMGGAAMTSAQVTHPIDTKPEGQKPECSYSGGVSFGDKKATPTSSNTCPTSTGTPVPTYTQPDYAAMAQQAVADQAAKDQAAKDDAAKQAAEQKKAAPAQNPSGTSPNPFAFPGETEVQKLNDDGTLAPPSAPAPTPAPVNGAAPSGSSSGAPGFHDAGSEGTSSSSSSSSSSSGDTSGVPEAPGVPGDTAPAPKRGRRKLPPVPRQSPDERETEDVQIGKFYMNDKNYVAAYLRAKDAITIQSDDWEAHLLLADSARKLGKFDEAQSEYKKTLNLDPIPKGRKAAEDALKEMGGNLSPNSIMP